MALASAVDTLLIKHWLPRESGGNCQAPLLPHAFKSRLQTQFILLQGILPFWPFQRLQALIRVVNVL